MLVIIMELANCAYLLNCLNQLNIMIQVLFDEKRHLRMKNMYYFPKDLSNLTL